MWTIFKVFIEFVAILFLLSMFWFYFILFFGFEVCGIFVPRTGIESISPAWEGDVLTTGPTEKSPHTSSFSYSFPCLP